MYIQKQRSKYKHHGSMGMVVGLFLFVFMGLGCASTHKTTTTETTVSYPDGAVGNGGNYYRTTTISGDDQNREVVKTSETTTTSTETKAENPGVLSSTLHAIGYVIALPFIIVGGLFKIIFGG